MATKTETVEKLQELIGEYESMNEELQSERRDITSAINGAESQVGTLISYIDDTDTAIRELEFEDIQTKVSELSDEVSELADRVSKCIDENNASDEKARTVSSELDALHSRLADAETSVDSMNGYVEQMKALVQELADEVEAEVVDDDPELADADAGHPSGPRSFHGYTVGERVAVGRMPAVEYGTVVDDDYDDPDYVPVRLDRETRTDRERSDAWMPAYVHREADIAALAEKVQTATPVEPDEDPLAAINRRLAERDIVGPAMNVRFGWVLGDSDELGEALLRADVNQDGMWVTPAMGGTLLADLLREAGISDVAFLEGRHVRVKRDPDGVYGYVITQVLSAEEAKADDEVKYGVSVQRFEVDGKGTFPVGQRFRGENTGAIYALTSFGKLEVLTNPESIGRVEVGTIHDALSTSCTPIPPLAEDVYGNPLYEGDRVEFTNSDSEGPRRGELIPGVGPEHVAVRRDDGKQGSGPGGSWSVRLGHAKTTFELLTKTSMLVAKKPITMPDGTEAKDRNGVPICVGDEVLVYGNGHYELDPEGDPTDKPYVGRKGTVRGITNDAPDLLGVDLVLDNGTRAGGYAVEGWEGITWGVAPRLVELADKPF